MSFSNIPLRLSCEYGDSLDSFLEELAKQKVKCQDLIL